MLKLAEQNILHPFGQTRLTFEGQTGEYASVFNQFGAHSERLETAMVDQIMANGS